MSDLIKIVKGPSKRFAIINLTGIEDPNLDSSTTGIYCYLVSRPPNWILRIKDVQNHFSCGRDAVYTALNKLIQFRYVYRFFRKNSKQQIQGNIYLIFEEPTPEEEAQRILQENQDQEFGAETESSFRGYGQPVNGVAVNGEDARLLNINNLLSNNTNKKQEINKINFLRDFPASQKSVPSEPLPPQPENPRTDIHLKDKTPSPQEQEEKTIGLLTSKAPAPPPIPGPEFSPSFGFEGVPIVGSQPFSQMPSMAPGTASSCESEESLEREPKKYQVGFIQTNSEPTLNREEIHPHHSGISGKKAKVQLKRGFQIKPDVQRIIEHWNSLEKIRKLRIDNLSPSKLYREIAQSLDDLLAGKFFVKTQDPDFVSNTQAFREGEVKETINRFHLAATAPGYGPAKKDTYQRISLTEFLYNPRWENGGRSLFLKFFKEESKERLQPIPDDRPEETKNLIYWYQKKFHGKDGNQEVFYSQQDKNNFIRGRVLLEKFYQTHDTMPHGIDQDYEWLMDALIEKVKDVRPYTFVQDWVYNNVLFEYLLKRQMIYSDAGMESNQRKWEKNKKGGKKKEEEDQEEVTWISCSSPKKEEVERNEYGDVIKKEKEEEPKVYGGHKSGKKEIEIGKGKRFVPID